MYDRRSRTMDILRMAIIVLGLAVSTFFFLWGLNTKANMVSKFTLMAIGVALGFSLCGYSLFCMTNC
jgi:hypothetical protein